MAETYLKVMALCTTLHHSVLGAWIQRDQALAAITNVTTKEAQIVEYSGME